MTDASTNSTSSDTPQPRPAPRALPPYDAMTGYATPARQTPIDLALDANEGPRSIGDRVLEAVGGSRAETLRCYPNEAPLEAAIAERFSLPAAHCMVTPGADAALERLLRVYTGPARALVVPTPTFAMIPIYAAFTQATVRTTAWMDDEFPLDETLASIDDGTGAVAVVSPNNPTGAVASRDALFAVAERAASMGAAFVLDAAYVEFADDDPTTELLAAFPEQTVVVRTLSKAWGLAGARVGYALGSPGLLAPLRVAGGPYTVAGPSLAWAAAALQHAEPLVRSAIDRVRTHRSQLESLLTQLGVRATRSQSNSVYAEYASAAAAAFAHALLLAQGVAVRAFTKPPLDRALRITVPDDPDDQQRLRHAIETALKPEAILLDIDGVVAGVHDSYRRCIIETAARFGVTLSKTDVAEAKRAGDANNDWRLTHRLVCERLSPARAPSLDEVTRVFESLYQGDAAAPGLYERETLLSSRDVLERLARHAPLAAVTGRPRRDAERFFRDHGIADLFCVTVCMEDAEQPKPDPACVRLALKILGASRAWMVGDTPDDARAARAASVAAIGVLAPGDEREPTSTSLLNAGAGFVLDSLEQLADRLDHAFGGASS